MSADPTPLPIPDARARLNALLGKQVCATVARGLGNSVETIRGELAAEGSLYVARRATVRYPDADVHVDHMRLVTVDETEPSPETIADTARIAHDAIMRRTDGDTELADLIARGVRDAYRTGWHRALAGHADAPKLEPVTARWDRITTRDENGTTWVLCTTDPGQPIALRLDEEHAEALAGSLLGTPDGEVVAAEDHAAIRDRIAIMLYTPPDSDSTPEWARAQDVALHQADAVMDDVAPALAERDRRIAELEEQLAVRALVQDGPLQVTTEAPDDVVRFRATGRWKVTVPPADDFHAAATWPARAVAQLDADAHP